MRMTSVSHLGLIHFVCAPADGPHLGEYMMHCHNNVHEDDDMFRAFMVRPRL